MTSFRIRPRFRFTSSTSPEEIKSEMKEKLKTTHQSFIAKTIEGHIIVKIKGEEKHYWSPQLDVAFEILPNGKTLIRGLYGPNPNVWTLFMFLYSSVIMSILFVAVYEGCQVSLGIMNSFSIVIPILIGVWILLYAISQFGQKLGAEQTFALHHFLEDTLHSHIDIE